MQIAEGRHPLPGQHPDYSRRRSGQPRRLRCGTTRQGSDFWVHVNVRRKPVSGWASRPTPPTSWLGALSPTASGRPPGTTNARPLPRTHGG